MHSTAAISEKCSIHCDISRTGGQAGASRRPGACTDSLLLEISDISVNSKSKIFFTTLGGRVVVGLKGPAVSSELGAHITDSGNWGGVAAEAVVVSSSSPDADSVKMGSLTHVAPATCTLSVSWAHVHVSVCAHVIFYIYMYM